MSRPLTVAVLSLVTALGAAACSSPEPEEFMAEMIDIDVDDPEDRVSRPVAVTVGPDGALTVTGWSSGVATLVTVDGGAVATRAVLPLPRRDGPGTGFAFAGEHLLGHWSIDRPGYVLAVLDPATGAVVAERPVTPWPEHATHPRVAVTSDALFLAAWTGHSAAPVLLRVDPGTGAVTASATLPLDPDLGGIDWSEVTALAVSPDGGTLVVAVASADLDEERKQTSLHRLDADLRPVGEPVPITPGEEWTLVEELAVDETGTAYATSVEDGETVLLSAAPGESTASTRAEFDDGVTALAVRDGVAWLVHIEDGLRLHRLDLDSGERTTSGRLCGDPGGGPDDGGAGGTLIATDERVYLAGECEQADRLWVVDPAAETAR